jgi:small subunit ribosomal protein S9
MADKKPISGKSDSEEQEKKTKERKNRYFYANGKRKTAIARVRLYENGKGDITINERPIDDYFFGTLIGNVKTPLKLVNVQNLFDITVKVIGGGLSAQSDAVRHGIAKALLQYDSAFRPVLKKAGLLTRDSRTKERKKYGLHRARRAPQWAKR